MTLWQGRRVLLTGHTGFKGAWAGRWLSQMGAKVHGLALPADPAPNLARSLGEAHLAGQHLIDLRDEDAVRETVAAVSPEIVLHMAAQPIVRASYDDPVGTFASNVQGTVHLLDALRGAPDVKAVLVVTSDKVYANDESARAFTEGDHLGGDDPYSASKAATEIAVASFAASYFRPRGIPVATARGGNVIGGGDFAAERLVPDIVRAAKSGNPLVLRNPASTRPWQHVLDCLAGYLRMAEQLITDPKNAPRCLNFGPRVDDPMIPTGDLAARIQTAMGIETCWELDQAETPAEKAHLSIDPGKAENLLNWQPMFDADTTVAWTAEWYAGYLAGRTMPELTDAQIRRYQELTT